MLGKEQLQESARNYLDGLITERECILLILNILLSADVTEEKPEKELVGWLAEQLLIVR